MGFLFRRKPRPPSLRLFGSEEEKWDGCFVLVREALETDLPVILVAHFKDTLTFLVKTLEVSDIPWEGHEQLAQGQPPMGRVTLLPASALSGELPGEEPVRGDPAARVILAELHPAAGHDEQVVKAFWGRPHPWDIRRLSSLEDPVIGAFCGPKMVSLIRGLGLDRNEALHSQMIDRAVVRAQGRLTSRAPDDRPYDNAAAWLKDNLHDRRS